MNIDQAKQIAIAQILEKLERQPHKDTEDDAIYFSPFRNERTPSFHVDKVKNVWFDHGSDLGGNAFDLVVQVLKIGGYGFLPEDALRWFRNTNFDPLSFKVIDRVKDKTSKWQLISDEDLEDIGLITYIRQRGVDLQLAKQYLREIYVQKRDSALKVYGLGFKNEDGGYEFRNKYFKSCVAPKTVTFVRAEKPKPDGVMIFEGFMDFLTYLTIKKGKLLHDIIVLNSVACLDHAVRYIKNYGYVFAYTWFDNDSAGQKARQRFDEFVNTEPYLTHKPLNYLYETHKDLNAWHMFNLNLCSPK